MDGEPRDVQVPDIMDQAAVEQLRDHVKSVMNTFRRERNEAKEQANTLRSNNREMQRQMDMLNQHIQLLTDENEELRSSYASVIESTSNHSALVSELNVLKAANILQGETVNTVTDQLEEQTMQMVQLQNIIEHLHQLVGQHERQIETQQAKLEAQQAQSKQQQAQIEHQQKMIETLRSTRRPLPSTSSSISLAGRDSQHFNLRDSGENSEHPSSPNPRPVPSTSRPLPSVQYGGTVGRSANLAQKMAEQNKEEVPAGSPNRRASSPHSTLRSEEEAIAKFENNEQLMASARASLNRRESTGHQNDHGSDSPPSPVVKAYKPPSKGGSFALTRSLSNMPSSSPPSTPPPNIPSPTPSTTSQPPEQEEQLLLITNAEGNKEVKGGTISKLVEKLTPSEGIVDTEYLNAFFLTYRSFATGEQVLTLLLKRYDDDTDQIIRIRVVDVLRRWLTDYYLDFAENPILMEQVKQFADTNVTKHHVEILASINKCISNQDRRGEVWAEVPMPTPIVPKSSNMIDFDPVELARQMCLQDFSLLVKIKQIELLRKPRPNLDFMIKRFNAVSNWIATQVVQTENLSLRFKLVKHCIKVAKELQNLGNFNGVMQIMSGLQSAAVHRLYKTWDKIAKSRYQEEMEALKSLTSTKDNYNQYRQALKNHPSPSIPFVGVALTDLTFIEDGMKNEIDGKKGLINFQKRKKMSMVVDTIVNCQLTPYRFVSEKTIQAALENCQSLTQSLMWQQSLKCEPRQEK
ncbi:hypothetical protein PROFUN_03499 [Planoprotostelium fungivorum]|uniref:Ras guanine nucleotide exchange factor n=1 Tax=Planoprotostelium fungivorum TaxID=1890364 RepID=A0A2P6MNC5_9EUKA|nr:hypothetical protein PROFUN_03499 [Planoprotostelium fungivorum]